MKAEDLRKSILQLAIQGKLVPQDPNDEPASALLERIRIEKQKLIKEGKIKKDKGDSIIFKGDDNRHYEKFADGTVKCVEDELPFEIPDSWCWCRLSYISSISAGGTPERNNPLYWINGDIPWLKISDITSSKKYVNSCTEYITESGILNSSAKIFPKGTILYTIFATIGEVGILNFDATCNQAIAGIQTFTNTINDYLYYYLVNLQDFMKSISKGCAQFNINQKILKSAFVPLPPLAEQARIPDRWEWIRVGNLFQHNTGKALNSSNTKGTKRQYITTSNLYWDSFKLDSLREMLFTDEEVEKCSLKKNDLLVCEGGDIGRAAIWHIDIPMCIQNHIHRLRAYETVEVYFYYYAFYLYKYSGLIGGKGIGIQGLSSNALAKLLFPLPPLQEQKRIVEAIRTIFSKIKDEN